MNVKTKCKNWIFAFFKHLHMNSYLRRFLKTFFFRNDSRYKEYVLTILECKLLLYLEVKTRRNLFFKFEKSTLIKCESSELFQKSFLKKKLGLKVCKTLSCLKELIKMSNSCFQQPITIFVSKRFKVETSPNLVIVSKENLHIQCAISKQH